MVEWRIWCGDVGSGLQDKRHTPPTSWSLSDGVPVACNSSCSMASMMSICSLGVSGRLGGNSLMSGSGVLCPLIWPVSNLHRIQDIKTSGVLCQLSWPASNLHRTQQDIRTSGVSCPLRWPASNLHRTQEDIKTSRVSCPLSWHMH